MRGRWSVRNLPAKPAESSPTISNGSGLSGADERYALLLEQVTRGLIQQVASLDDLRNRAGTVVAAPSLASSFLGATVLRDTHLPAPAVFFAVLALVTLVVTVGATIYILLPRSWRTGFDGHRLTVDYLEAEPPASLDRTRRDLAYYIQDDVNSNDKQLNRLHRSFGVAVVSIGLQVAFWLTALLLR